MTTATVLVTKTDLGYVAHVEGKNELTHRAIASTPEKALMRLLTQYGTELGLELKLAEGVEVYLK